MQTSRSRIQRCVLRCVVIVTVALLTLLFGCDQSPDRAPAGTAAGATPSSQPAAASGLQAKLLRQEWRTLRAGSHVGTGAGTATVTADLSALRINVEFTNTFQGEQSIAPAFVLLDGRGTTVSKLTRTDSVTHGPITLRAHETRVVEFDSDFNLPQALRQLAPLRVAEPSRQWQWQADDLPSADSQATTKPAVSNTAGVQASLRSQEWRMMKKGELVATASGEKVPVTADLASLRIAVNFQNPSIETQHVDTPFVLVDDGGTVLRRFYRSERIDEDLNVGLKPGETATVEFETGFTGLDKLSRGGGKWIVHPSQPWKWKADALPAAQPTTEEEGRRREAERPATAEAAEGARKQRAREAAAAEAEETREQQERRDRLAPAWPTEKVMFVVDTSGSMIQSFDLVRLLLAQVASTADDGKWFDVVWAGPATQSFAGRLVQMSARTRKELLAAVDISTVRGTDEAIPEAFGAAQREGATSIVFITDGGWSFEPERLSKVAKVGEVVVNVVLCDNDTSDLEQHAARANELARATGGKCFRFNSDRLEPLKAPGKPNNADLPR